MDFCSLVFLCFPIQFHMDFLPMMFSRTSYHMVFPMVSHRHFFCRKSKESTRGPPRKKKRDLRKNARVTPRKSAGKYKKSTEIARGIPSILRLITTTIITTYFCFVLLCCGEGRGRSKKKLEKIGETKKRSPPPT